MNILHVVSGSLSGGAAKGAFWLHKGLNNIGVNSVLLSNRKKELHDETVISLAETFSQKAKFELLPFIGQSPKYFYRNLQTQQLFNTGFEGVDITKLKAYKSADIVHLHWINGFISMRSLRKIKKPIIWTIRDMWPFTGGCHISNTCDRYKLGCGRCPVLASNCNFDLSYFVIKNKKKYIPQNIILVGISNWISECMKNSLLFHDSEIYTIFNNIETDEFRPAAKNVARELLSIPQRKKIVLVGAQYLWHQHKGFDIFFEALKELKSKEEIHIVFFGRNNLSIDSVQNFPHTYLGYLTDNMSLRLVYSAADVFVAPSRTETFGKTLAESLACGTPVVCFDATGPSDIVEHMVTGYKARPYSPVDLAVGIDWVLSLPPEQFVNMQKDSRKRAVALFDSKAIARQYLELYQKSLEFTSY